MNKHDAIQLILGQFPSAYLVSTCGHISRDLYNINDRARNFYMVGSMGMAAPVGLGLSTVYPDVPLVVLDGDGSFLMNMGIITMIGHQKPKNFIHVVLDNGMHEKTGGQRTVPLVNVTDIALQVGYEYAIEINSGQKSFDLPNEGPGLIHIKVEPRSEKIGKRVHWTPQEIVQRFTNELTLENEVSV